MAIRHDSDVIIIGAGPAGLFAAFQLGLHGFSALLVEADRRTGGQLSALYADKPVFDMPATGEILAGTLAADLYAQANRFNPVIRLGCRAQAISLVPDGFAVDLSDGETLHAGQVIVASGLGPLDSPAGRVSVALPPGVVVDNGHLPVTSDSFSTVVPGLHAIGDAAAYPGKLPLLVSAFHEAALAAFSIRSQRAGGKRVAVEFSSTSSAVRNRLG